MAICLPTLPWKQECPILSNLKLFCKLFLAISLVSAPARASCKLALALGLDVSSSVDSDEYRQQVDGLAAALTAPKVIDAILQPEGSHIAVTVYEWSGYQQQDVIVGWTVLDTPAAIGALAQHLKAHRRLYAEFPTALGKGVEFGALLLDSGPTCTRRTIDISGDGQNNVGVGPEYFAGTGLLDDITVNGLVIRGAVPDPVPYYQSSVRHGEDAFVIVAEGFSDYRRAMEEKLLREIEAQLVIGER